MTRCPDWDDLVDEVDELDDEEALELSAEEFFTLFHWGESPEEELEIESERYAGEKVVALGHLEGVIYDTTKGGDPGAQLYEHTFNEPRPLLIMDANGELGIVGGAYTVGEPGIID